MSRSLIFLEKLYLQILEAFLDSVILVVYLECHISRMHGHFIWGAVPMS